MLTANDATLRKNATYAQGLRDLAEMQHVTPQVGSVLTDSADLIDKLDEVIETNNRKSSPITDDMVSSVCFTSLIIVAMICSTVYFVFR